MITDRRNIYTVSFGSAIRSFGTGAAWVFSALYMSNILKVPSLVIGIVFSVNAITGGIVQIYSGKLGDALGYKRTLLYFSFGNFVSYFLLFISAHLYLTALIFIPLFILNNVMSSLYQPSANAIISLSSDIPLSGFSVMRIATNLGWAFGPAVGGLVISAFGYADMFLIASLATFSAFVAYTILNDVKGAVSSGGLNISKANRNIFFLGAATIFLFVVVSQFTVTLSLYANHIAGLGSASIGFIYLVNGLVVVLFQYPVYLVVRKMGMWNGMILGTALYIIGYFSISLDHSIFQFFASMFVITMGENFVTPTGNALVSEIAHGEDVGTYMGIYNFFNSFGRAMGPAYGTMLLTYLMSPYEIWGLAVVPGFIAFTIFYILKANSKRKSAGIVATEPALRK
ncbi:MAG: MFS transporter [Thermoplasmata archaeon]